MEQEPYRTIVFADICDSTGIFEHYGDIEGRNIIADVLASLSQIAKQHRGEVVKTIGDEVMCAFADPFAAVTAASEMQAYVADDAELNQHSIAIRVGLHYGKVLLENNDVFGDTVNVAARVADLASARQIVTTRTTIGELADTDIADIRELGNVRLKGKREAIELVELVWRREWDMTTTTPVLQMPKLGEIHYLSLSYRHQIITVDLTPLTSPIKIGRDQTNDVVINHDLVSRYHAIIECRKGYFVFTDRSTNGSYLKIDDEQEFHVRHGEVPLRGTGTISLSQSTAQDDPFLTLHYECGVR